LPTFGRPTRANRASRVTLTLDLKLNAFREDGDDPIEELPGPSPVQRGHRERLAQAELVEVRG